MQRCRGNSKKVNENLVQINGCDNASEQIGNKQSKQMHGQGAGKRNIKRN